MRRVWRRPRHTPAHEGFTAGAKRGRIGALRRRRRGRGPQQSDADAAAEATRRLATLDAIAWATSSCTDLVEIAYHCRDSADLDSQLVERYGFTAEQCAALRALPIRQLTETRRAAVYRERDALRDFLAHDRQSPQDAVWAQHPRTAFIHDTVIDYLEHHWSFMADEKPRVLRSWINDGHMLFVYQPAPQTAPDLVLGLEYLVDGGPSPTGLTDPTDTELALEIARYQILEPSGPPAAVPGTIYWTPPYARSVWRPTTVEQLRAMP